jgi:UDP-N-acetylglucosamine--N-acetylmuramyl-(pentapeptide) pyrophosphoryl-undecaprenol N-acetylglucosamine transferase
MKIVFAGGGTGGHFYPVIAVAQRINKIIAEEKIIGVKLYYLSTEPYDQEALFENDIQFEGIKAGKLRTYFSFENFSDIPKTLIGILHALWKMFQIYPDVVFGKGGYASFPTLLAARILRIPILIHESDSAPGRVNLWAGRFADKIAVSFKEAADFFPKERIAWTGHPIRLELEQKADRREALDFFKLESNLPTIFVIGGSLGAELINNTVIDALPRLLKNYQIIHQTGVRNFKTVTSRVPVVVPDATLRSRYSSIAFLNPLQMKMAAGAADLIISRAGSTLFEISSWGVPSILVPFTNSNADHAKKNAFAYAHTGACSVVEEMNMTANILSSEIDRILGDEKTLARMAAAAKSFNRIGGAEKIAQELLSIALSHEK